MQSSSLYRWILDSYKQTSDSLSDVRDRIERKLIGLMAAGRMEASEAIKTLAKTRTQIAELKSHIESRVIRKYEAVLDILGIPSEREIEDLKKRVERLNRMVKRLGNEDKSSTGAPKG